MAQYKKVTTCTKRKMIAGHNVCLHQDQKMVKINAPKKPVGLGLVSWVQSLFKPRGFNVTNERRILSKR